jgi:hypothetical protein
MNTPTSNGSADDGDLGHLHDLAVRRAHELRQDAINDFWLGTEAVFARGLVSAQRSAQRLAHRLSQHRRGRTWTIE